MNRILWFAVLLFAGMPCLAAAQSSAEFSVSGRVVRSSAVPRTPTETNVILTDAATGREVGAVAAGPDGAFKVTKVRAGTYRLQVLRTEASWNVDPVVIAVNDRDVTGVELAITAMIDVVWTVAVEGGGLRPPVTVTLVSYRGGQSARSIAIGDASVTRPIPEGEYRVAWGALPAGYEMKSIVTGSLDVLTGRLKVGGGEAPKVTITLGVSNPPPWVKVSGRAITIPQAPLAAGTQIVLEDQSSGRRTSEAPVAADGAFEFPMVLPGTYRPLVTGSQPAQIIAPPSIVVPGADLSGVQLALAPMKMVKGKVTVEGRAPDKVDKGDRGPGLMIVVNNRVQSTVVIQPDGSFSILLPVGSASFLAVVPEYAVKSLIYGGSNLLTGPLTIGATDAAELQVTVAPTEK